MYRTPDNIARRRAMAQTLYGGAAQNVRTDDWGQAIANAAKALAGGYWMGEDNQADQQARDDYAENIAATLRNYGGAMGLGEQDLAALQSQPLDTQAQAVQALQEQMIAANAPLSRGEERKLKIQGDWREADNVAAAARNDATIEGQNSRNRQTIQSQRDIAANALSERKRQYDETLGEEKRRYDTTLEEETRRWNAEYGLDFLKHDDAKRAVEALRSSGVSPEVASEFNEQVAKNTANEIKSDGEQLDQIDNTLQYYVQLDKIADNPELDYGYGWLGEGLRNLAYQFGFAQESKTANNKYDSLSAALTVQALEALKGVATDRDMKVVELTVPNREFTEKANKASRAAGQFMFRGMRQILLDKREMLRQSQGTGLTAQQDADLRARSEKVMMETASILAIDYDNLEEKGLKDLSIEELQRIANGG